MKRRVVITGLGTVNPCGLDVGSSWSKIKNGQSANGYLTRFDATGWPSRVAGEVDGFDSVGRFGRKAAKRMGLFLDLHSLRAWKPWRTLDLGKV